MPPPPHIHIPPGGEGGVTAGAAPRAASKRPAARPVRHVALTHPVASQRRAEGPFHRGVPLNGRKGWWEQPGKAGLLELSLRAGLPPRSFLSWMEGQDYYVKQALLLVGCWTPQAACQGMMFRSGHWVLRKSVSTAESQPRELCLSGRTQSGAACLYGKETLLECK